MELHDALAELEIAAALVLLAEREKQAIDDTLPRLRQALATVIEARDLATELAGATGRPPLRVLVGGCGSAGAGRGVALDHRCNEE